MLQLRSGITSRGKVDFVSALVEFCFAEQVGEVIVLTSSSAEERIDEQLTGQQFRYLSTQGGNMFKYAYHMILHNHHCQFTISLANWIGLHWRNASGSLDWSMERRRPMPTPSRRQICQVALPQVVSSYPVFIKSRGPRHQRQQTNLGPSASLTLSSLFIVIVLTTRRARQRSQQHRRQNF